MKIKNFLLYISCMVSHQAANNPSQKLNGSLVYPISMVAQKEKFLPNKIGKSDITNNVSSLEQEGIKNAKEYEKIYKTLKAIGFIKNKISTYNMFYRMPVIVIGDTGTGKSTLINDFLGHTLEGIYKEEEMESEDENYKHHYKHEKKKLIGVEVGKEKQGYDVAMISDKKSVSGTVNPYFYTLVKRPEKNTFNIFLLGYIRENIYPNFTFLPQEICNAFFIFSFPRFTNEGYLDTPGFNDPNSQKGLHVCIANNFATRSYLYSKAIIYLFHFDILKMSRGHYFREKIMKNLLTIFHVDDIYSKEVDKLIDLDKLKKILKSVLILLLFIFFKSCKDLKDFSRASFASGKRFFSECIRPK